MPTSATRKIQIPQEGAESLFGTYDEKAGAVGSLWDVLRDRRLNHRPEVVSGVLADECSKVLLEFFATQRGSDEPGFGQPVPSASRSARGRPGWPACPHRCATPAAR